MPLGNIGRTLTIEDAEHLAFWRRPVFLLFLMSAAMPLSFATWNALLNNFVIEVAGFDGVGIGWLHTVREIPGFLAVGVILLIVVIREQVLAVSALMLLGAATAVVAWFPTYGGLLATTMVGSVGFHYFETINQSLQLQWIRKEDAPKVIGWIVAIGSGGALISYGLLVLTWKTLDLSYNLVYMLAGGATLLIAAYCVLAYPQFQTPNRQRTELVLRWRYWLFYVFEFISSARRQIFVVFAAFMMVERFGFEVHEVTALFIVNYLANMIAAPLMGKAVSLFGERAALAFEYGGLTLVFLAYGGIYYFGWGVLIAAALYILDHLFFALSFALRTYFQKIADPGDIAPTAAVSFTINHIAAVFLPALLGYLWIVSPGMVFAMAAALAFISLLLVILVPRHPRPGYETILAGRWPRGHY